MPNSPQISDSEQPGIVDFDTGENFYGLVDQWIQQFQPTNQQEDGEVDVDGALIQQLGDGRFRADSSVDPFMPQYDQQDNREVGVDEALIQEILTNGYDEDIVGGQQSEGDDFSYLSLAGEVFDNYDTGLFDLTVSSNSESQDEAE